MSYPAASCEQLSEDGQSHQMTGDSLDGRVKTGCLEGKEPVGSEFSGEVVRGLASTPVVFNYGSAGCLTHPSSLALVGKPAHLLSHEDTLL